MCGRYSFTSPLEAVRRLFQVSGGGNLAPRYNIAPTQPAVVARPSLKPGEARELAILTWGLVPSWAKDAAIASKLINARAETVAEKPSFRNAFRRRRCLVPADGFYEWKAAPGGKQPYRVSFEDERPFAFAGIWEHWQGADGSEIESFAIVTTDANALLRPLHPRMPVILEPEQHAPWLDTGNEDAGALLGPYAGEGLCYYPVSRHVNNVRNDDAECIRPLEAPGKPVPAQGRLL